MRLVRLAQWWVREGIPERVRYHWVRKNPWIRARQLDIERRYWKARCQRIERQLL